MNWYSKYIYINRKGHTVEYTIESVNMHFAAS
jgi:hypothetical protein